MSIDDTINALAAINSVAAENARVDAALWRNPRDPYLVADRVRVQQRWQAVSMALDVEAPGDGCVYLVERRR